MKKKFKLQQWLPSAVFGLMLAGSTSVTQAQVTAQNPQTFDTGIGSWVIWDKWGMQGWPLTWDSTLDASNSPTPGSLRYEVPFVGAGGEQIMTFGTLANRWGWDGGVVVNCIGTYTNLSLDLKVDPTTAPTVNNNYGPLELGLVTSSWGTIGLGTFNIPLSATNWTHVVMPINPTLANLDKVTGFFIKMWSNGTFTNTLAFNVDDVWLQPVPTNTPPPPPPTMTLEKAAPGLNFIAATSGKWDRQNIRTVGTNYSWVGHGSTPVNYSFTISSYPGPGHSSFEVHNYLIPLPYDPASGTLGTIGTGSSSPDWDQTNCIFMDLQNQTNGSATWMFRWKTNSIPDGNGTYYSSPLSILNDPAGPLGTWTLTFVNNTNVTMISPSGITTNFQYSADKLAGYVDTNGAALPLYYYIGIKANNDDNRGLAAVLSRATVQGVSVPIDDHFLNDSTLDTNIWEVVANSSVGVQLVLPGAVYWVNWTLPDAGYVLETNSVVTGKPWNANVLTPLSLATGKKALISLSDLPDGNQGYFRLVKRVATKLQVLLPGETNAPGTVTGKIGTPDPQTLGVYIPITVNAVDDKWNIKTDISDTVHLTTSDPGVLPEYLPADAALAGGTFTFQTFYFMSSGTWTVTATDVTTNAIAAGTSTPITIP